MINNINIEKEFLNQELIEESEKENDFARNLSYQGGTEELERIFDEFEEPQKRKVEILKKTTPFLKAAGVNEQSFDSKLDSICVLGKEDFLQASFELVKPILDFALEDSTTFEAVERQLFLREGGLSEVLGYSVEAPILYLHLAPCSSLSLVFVLREVEKGMKNLAKILENLPKIQKIRGVSSLIEERPELMKKFGFSLIEVMGIEYGSDEPMKIVEITRADFLKRWSK